MSNDSIENLLTHHFARQPGDEAAAARVMARIAGPLPRQKIAFWKNLPNILLDWQFAPAWPRVAMLAACAALGFFVGLSGLDARIDDASAQYSAATSGDLSAVFEPEPLTGARP
jgi:hypothetical protein